MNFSRSATEAEVMSAASPGNVVRVGILGCSDIARRKLVPALCRSETAVLAAVASREREKAAALAPGERYELLGYEELLCSPAVDLVYLSLPNHLHEEWTIRALEQGKHVICEKPLGLTADSVERMLRAAEQRNLLLYENLMYLHHPQHAAVKELLATGRLGRITALRSVFGFPFPQEGNFRLVPAMGGGAFHDLARYPLGTALHFLQGDISRFRGVALARDGLNVAMHGVAATSAREIFTFSIAFGQQYESFYEIVGELGKVRVERAYTTPAELANRIEVTRGTRDESFTVAASDHFQLMIEHVCALAGNGEGVRAAHERSRRLARLAEAMERGCVHA
jgi:dTDP-3,4-didehydro-2,6-dideoxy-alpha-D-glucose 3-reductase